MSRSAYWKAISFVPSSSTTSNVIVPGAISAKWRTSTQATTNFRPARCRPSGTRPPPAARRVQVVPVRRDEAVRLRPVRDADVPLVGGRARAEHEVAVGRHLHARERRAEEAEREGQRHGRRRVVSERQPGAAGGRVDPGVRAVLEAVVVDDGAGGGLRVAAGRPPRSSARRRVCGTKLPGIEPVAARRQRDRGAVRGHRQRARVTAQVAPIARISTGSPIETVKPGRGDSIHVFPAPEQRTARSRLSRPLRRDPRQRGALVDRAQEQRLRRQVGRGREHRPQQRRGACDVRRRHRRAAPPVVGAARQRRVDAVAGRGQVDALAAEVRELGERVARVGRRDGDDVGDVVRGRVVRLRVVVARVVPGGGDEQRPEPVGLGERVDRRLRVALAAPGRVDDVRALARRRRGSR